MNQEVSSARSQTRNGVSGSGLRRTNSRIDQTNLDLVDAVVAALDSDRSAEVERVRSAFEPFGLDEAFVIELRLSGIASLTWERCEFCSDVLASLDAPEGRAA